MDAFYVSCELRERPDLAGRPVVVGPDPRLGFARGVVLSASYEARKFGIRSAMPAARALRACPEAVWLPADFPKYERMSREIRQLLRRHSDHVVPLSIDEAAARVDVADPEAARRAASAVQTELLEELRLPASIGVSPDRTIAKIASDRAKPGGIVVVPEVEARAFLAPLPVEVVPGVGPKTAERLHAVGVSTVGSILDLDSARLRESVGEMASYLRSLARGTPPDQTDEDDLRGPRSRSSAQTFGDDVGDLEALQEVATGLAMGLAESLASEKLQFQTVTVALRWEDFDRTQRSRTLHAAHQDEVTLRDSARRILNEAWREEQRGAARRVRTLSVGVERLSDRRSRQPVLESFDAPTNDKSAASMGTHRAA